MSALHSFLSENGLTLVDGDVEAGGDDTSLVQSSIELNDNFVRTVVVNDLELANVS